MVHLGEIEHSAIGCVRVFRELEAAEASPKFLD